MIHLRLDAGSAMPAYAQLVRQVRRAVLRGVLVPGDRLPTAREVVATLAINPNTVLKAYAELEHQGVAYSRAGSGTFIAETAPAPIAQRAQRTLRPALDAWLQRARAAGLSEEEVWSLIDFAVEDAYGVHVA